MLSRKQLLEKAAKVISKSKEEVGPVQIFIDVDQDVLKTEDGLALEGSRLYGRPALPADVDWPAGYYFYGQFNLSKLSPHDPLDVLPKKGMLYLFLNPAASDYRPASPTAAKAIYVDAVPELALRQPPPKAKLPLGGKHYYDRFLKKTNTLKFKTAFSFNDPRRASKKLIASLEDALGIAFVDSRSNFFGEPITWQGEDDLFGPDDWDWEHDGLPPAPPDRVLLFQNDFIDGHIHFWGRSKAMKKGDFSTLEATASTT